ncbi:MAG: TetR/AcrR family transcriptional regulator [Paracoccaceae bacterium]|nr:TetR/AcrR family transcriptional regulator [Paracoccaceae bacterium]
MDQVKQKTGYHHGDLRQQLVAATRALVEEKGPDLFSVSEACRAAGVSTAAPYRHFADRTEMLIAVALEGFGEMTASFETALAGHEPGSNDAITAVGTAYVDYAEANPGLFRMMFAGDHQSDALEEAGHGCYAVVLGQVARRMGRAEVDDAVMQAAFPLWTFVHGLAFLRIDGKAEFAKMQTEVRDLVGFATQRLMVRPG